MTTHAIQPAASKRVGPTRPRRIIVEMTAMAHGLTVQDLTGPDRHRPIVRVRWRAMAEMRREGYSLPQIGRALKRDHTTIIYGLRRLQVIEADRIQ